MRGGTLDRIIEIQRKTESQSPSGEVSEAWTTITRRPAQLVALQGDERFQAQQYIARAQFAFTIRWANAVSKVTPLDRIVWPAVADSPPSNPQESTVYDIMAVEPVGRNEGIRILTAVRQDVPS